MHVRFSIHTSIKRNKSTVDYFNLISNHSYTNLRENMFEIKRNSNWPKKRKNKLTNGQGGTISQLWAAIFERIRNVQIQDFQTVFFFFFFFFLSSVIAVCMRFPSLIQTLPSSRRLQWRIARFCNVLFDVTSCYWIFLLKMASALFLLGQFSFIELWTFFKQ